MLSKSFPRRRHLTWLAVSLALALALAEHLPAANIEIAVEFRKPVRLPSEVTLLSSAPGSSGDLQLVGAGELQHMLGTWRPIA